MNSKRKLSITFLNGLVVSNYLTLQNGFCAVIFIFCTNELKSDIFHTGIK